MLLEDGMRFCGVMVNGVKYRPNGQHSPVRLTRAQVRWYETLGVWEMRDQTYRNMCTPAYREDPRLDSAVRKFLGIRRPQ